MKEGLIHLYYGDGKGKTTAAVGLSILEQLKQVSILRCE